MASNTDTRPKLPRKVSALTIRTSEDQRPTRLRGRESLVSINSYYASPPFGSVSAESEPASSGWSVLQDRQASGRSVTTDSSPKKGRGKRFFERSQATLVEDESYDMDLLKGAAPMGKSDEEPYGTVPEATPDEPLFDVTSFSGPISSQDREFLKKLHEQEASGTLTGGIGMGIIPDTRIKEDELVAASPIVTRLKQDDLVAASPIVKLKRAFTFKQKPTDRKASIKGIGQCEANRRGKVIEVVMDEDYNVDLSNMVGPNFDPKGKDDSEEPEDGYGTYDPDHMRDHLSQAVRQANLANQGKKTEIFYPQPNWKPFSMRWSYLLGLILLSLLLAIVQEVIYQQSTRKPLLKFTRPSEISPFDYFVVRFIPTIISVTFGVLWQITDFDVIRLEAFHQMSKEGGALAAESINISYPTMINILRPLRAYQRRHYAVVVSSVTSLLASSLVPTLGAAAIVLSPDRETRLANIAAEKTITVNPVLSRLLTMSLIFIAFMGMLLFYLLQYRRSGLLGDVKGIAGLASMAVVSHIMMDFKDLDVAQPKDIHHRLKDHRYILRNNSLAPDKENPVSRQESDRYDQENISGNPHPLILRTEGGIPFIAGIMMFFVFMPIVLFTPANELTEKAPWVVTALAVLIKMSWGSLESEIRMMEPYYILSKRHAPAKTLTLDYTSMPFAWVAVRAALNKHWMVFAVGLGSIFAEAFTIFVTSLGTVAGKDFIEQIKQSQPGPDGELHAGPTRSGLDQAFDAGQETVSSFIASFVLTSLILLYMFVVATVVFVRRRHPFLPRQPNTIASVLAFMHQSKMLYDFVGTAKFTEAEMVQKLESIGKTYGLGIFEGRDGLTHCGVDEEELSGFYKHGVDFSAGNKPWDRDWQLY